MKTRPLDSVYFAKDRLCAECNCAYSPPTPAWAAIVFLVLGALIGLIGLVGLLFYVLAISREPEPGPGCFSLFFNSLFFAMGFLAIQFAFKAFRQKPIEPGSLATRHAAEPPPLPPTA